MMRATYEAEKKPMRQGMVPFAQAATTWQSNRLRRYGPDVVRAASHPNHRHGDTHRRVSHASLTGRYEVRLRPFLYLDERGQVAASVRPALRQRSMSRIALSFQAVAACPCT